MFTSFMSKEQIIKYYDKKREKQIIKDNASTECKKAILENRKKLLPKLIEIRELKRKMKEPATRKTVSNLLLFLAIIMTFVTTLTTIAGGISFRQSIFTQLTFILFVSFSQFVILIISCIKPYLAKKSPKYNNLLFYLQLGLLMVSISFNYIFMDISENTFFIQVLNLILCIIFDVVILVMCEISFTIRLNLEFIQENKSNTLLSRIFKIIYSLIDYKITSIENKIKNKMFSENENSINDLDIKKYLDYAKENIKENNQLMSYKEIGKHLNITEHKAKNTHNFLVEKGIIKTENKKSYLKKVEV